MISFRLEKHSIKSRARLGVLTTPHGTIETPAFVPVATRAAVKTLTSEQAAQAGCQTLIANTFHLHLRPGENIIAQAGGLHRFMNWPRPLMTDSGGFQVFSLGFGRDHGVGKVLTNNETRNLSGSIPGSRRVITAGQQPTRLTITDDGVAFTSPVDGRALFLGPRESIATQEKLGADIIFAFDEPTSPVADETYTQQSLDRTHRWAKQCLEAKTSDQAIFGIVQGGKFERLRQTSARTVSAMPFDGFGIGGEYGDDKEHMKKILAWVTDELPPAKPRHVLGIGHPEDIPELVRAGADLFDCIVPTHYARHGTAFASASERPPKPAAKTGIAYERLNLKQSQYLTDQQPLDPACTCPVCSSYKRNYLAHLLRAEEITALHLLTLHNLHFFNRFVAALRAQIKKGEI